MSTPAGISDLLDQLRTQLLEVVKERNELRAERRRLREALTQIAAFGDDGANVILRKTGSYSGFDEPGAVQAAREALGNQKGPSE